MQLPDAPSPARRGARLLIVGLALGLAALPAACGTLSGGGKSSNNDPSATTVFRTITVELATSTSAAPDAGAAAAARARRQRGHAQPGRLRGPGR